MKISTLLSLSAALTSTMAFPAFINIEARQIWEPKPWTAPGPNDGQSCPLLVR